MTEARYDAVDASPTKDFFVSMLVRDISLTDTILDLLDNCIDGLQRLPAPKSDLPYQGRWARISFGHGSFSITDNCGGIPWSLHEYAWRLGRPRKAPSAAAPTIGVYGIGLKRALFKLGHHSVVRTQNGDDRYEVEITPQWMKSEGSADSWLLQPRPGRSRMDEDGTAIEVRTLRDEAKHAFGADRKAFESDLCGRISEHYAVIMGKGFGVSVNDQPVKPRSVKLLFSPKIQPYIYQQDSEGVRVFLAVGLTRPVPTKDELDADAQTPRFSRADAGWTVICNDRVVVCCDKTELTGWGTGHVPSYHNQFIAISGVVEFVGDPAKLPMTTTKRGLNASSALFLRVKDRMMEGTKLFTNFTYRWKSRETEARAALASAQPAPMEEIKTKAKGLRLHAVRQGGAEGRLWKPKLPMPPARESDAMIIRFSRPVAAVRAVSRYLFSRDDRDPSDVGAECFDRIHGESKR